jgi:AsmA protein
MESKSIVIPSLDCLTPSVMRSFMREERTIQVHPFAADASRLTAASSHVKLQSERIHALKGTSVNKLWVKGVGGLLALLIIVIALVPLFINGDTFRPTVESQLSNALGRKVTFDRLSFSLLAGSLTAENIAIAEDPAFSTWPFLHAKKLEIGVEVGPLLFHHQVRITKLTIDAPSIQLIQAQNGKWNFSSIGGSSSAPQQPPQPTSIPDLTVGELKIKGGSVAVSSVPATPKPFVYSDVGIDVKQFSFAKSFPFDLSAKLPGDGTLKLNGTAGPVAQKDTSDTPFQATIQLKHFDPVAAGVIEASKGVSMIDDVGAQLTSDGVTVSSTGKISAERLQLAPHGSPAQRSVNIDYTVSNDLSTRTGRVSDIAIHTGSVSVHITGGFKFTPQAIVLDLHLAAPNLPIDQLEQLLPVVGIRLPSGSSLQDGNLTANVAVTGPATETTISGPVEINNTRLAGFDLGSKIGGLNPFGGTGGGTQIQTLRAVIHSSPQSTEITNIYGNLPQIGSATGGGTIAPSGALDFKMVATLNSSNTVGAVANMAANTVGNLVGGFFHPKAKPTANTNRGIPLTITGTSSSPTIRANVSAMLR